MNEYMTEQEIIFRNRKVAYSIGGNGFPLVFIHGFCEDKSMWNDFVEFFVADYQVIMIDVGGFGASELPIEPTIAEMAMQVNAVLRVEGIQKCLLIGHSMGGYIAMDFAELFGDKLIGITMFHTHPFGDTVTKKRNRNKGILFLNKYGTSKYVASLMPKLFFAKARVTHKIVLERLIERAKRYSKEAIISGLIAMRDRQNQALVLEKIDCPVQFIVGKEDTVIDWSQSMGQLHLPRIASIHLLENVGHLGMFEVKNVTQKLVYDFVQFSIKNYF
ncbi:MAG: alpha/beta fold hydrolase [Saprospiraceae bacterium]